MLTFLKKEYKTILIVFVLLGGLFTYFYIDESKKLKHDEEEKIKYICFEPGKSLAKYSLGTPLDPDKFKTFNPLANDDKTRQSLESADKSLRLNFVNAQLISIEYYPKASSPEYLECQNDSEAFLKKAQMRQSPLDLGDKQLLRYQGLGIFYAPDPEATDDIENKAMVPIGWMLVPNA